jgi:aryl-alcohol dehydrogenase-like predicted oxidoreductase
MQYRKLGRTGLKVSRICLGTMTFGSQVEEAAAIGIIKSAMGAGVNFFDTADQYINGRSEEIVGKALKGERHSVVLATKIGAWQSGPSVNDIGASRKHIMKGVEDSLRRLGTDYIDLYYVHRPDYDTPIEETLRAMDDLIHQGKVRYIACSNFRAWQLAKALSVSELHNLARFECVQPPYNLLTRDLEYELLPFCESEEVGVCVYNPLAAGLLTGKHDAKKPPAEGGRFTQERLGPMYLERYWSDINFNAIERLKQVAEEHGHNMAQFALAWVLNQPAITAAACGISSAKQLEINAAAVEIALSQEELAACDEVWRQLRPPRFLYGR